MVVTKFGSKEEIVDSKAELKSVYDFEVNHIRHPIVTNSFFLKSDVYYLLNKYGRIMLNEQMGDNPVGSCWLFRQEQFRAASQRKTYRIPE